MNEQVVFLIPILAVIGNLLLVLLVLLATFEVLFVGRRSICSVYEVLTRLSRLNASEFDAEVHNMYTECKV